MNRTKTYVVNAFKAADLDGNKMCNLSEFVLLYRHIESDKFSEDEVIKLFEDSADIVKESEKNMSFEKFTSISVDFQLFSDAQQDKFLQIKSGVELEDRFKLLQTNWDFSKKTLLEHLDDLKNNLDASIHENWMNILSVLETRITTEQEVSEIKPVLIAFKIMNDELERIIKQKQMLYEKALEEEEEGEEDGEGSRHEEADDDEEGDKVMELN